MFTCSGGHNKGARKPIRSVVRLYAPIDSRHGPRYARR
jgi:hypothetical protein